MEAEFPTIKIIQKKKTGIKIGTSSIVGTRKNQEDTIFGYGEGKQAIGIVCDGLGGLNGGEQASRSAAESLAEAWFAQEYVEDIPKFLFQEAKRADTKVHEQERADGKRLCAGTTIAAAVIQESELYWLSVGDSRIYIVRGDEIMIVNRDHNYRMVLDRKLEQGEITLEEYTSEECQAGALISYLGMGNVSLMDINRQAFQLVDGDIILLSSDGLYRSVSENEILEILIRCRDDMQAAAESLTAAASGKMAASQDNASVVVLRYCPK